MRSAQSLRIAVALAALGAVVACQAVGAGGSGGRVVDQFSAACPEALTVTPPSGRAPTIQVYRRAGDWSAAIALAPGADRLAAWAPEFARGETVLRVDGGPKPTPGWRWKSGEPELDPGRQLLRIPVALEPPPAGTMQAQVISHPCLYLRLAPTDYQRVEVVAPR